MSLPTRALGKNGPRVTAIGFGLMGMSAFYGPALEDKDAFPLLDRAIELGCTFWDTSNIYGANEETLNRYFKARPDAREKVFLATKFGATFIDGVWGERGDYDYVIECANKALARLGTTYIDLFYVHRIDSRTPIEITIKALVQLKNEGKIRHIGLSEASATTLRRAHAIHPIAAHQVEYSPFELTIESESNGVLKTCRELGITVVAYSPIGRGMLAGKIRSPEDFDESDFRRHMPRFSQENFFKNLEVVDKFADIAKRHNATPGQLALAWLLAQGPEVIPIPGTTRIANLEENVAAAAVKLTDGELSELSGVIRGVEVSGERYPTYMMANTYRDTVTFEKVAA
ncbi:putative aldo-keto reductase [Auriculariales sp. MPI-PUGE-AT-0066]|nr:putative aldo-keto reductase [Auriculariales sp. MPI-PUGE-AT-0066]